MSLRFLISGLITFLSSLSMALTEPSLQEPIVVVFPENFPPEYQLTPEGEPFGYAIEIMDEVARRAGLTIRYQPVKNWTQVFQQFENQQADMIPNIGITEQRAEQFHFSQPYESFDIRIFIRKEDSEIKNLADLKNGQACTTIHNVANQFAKNLQLTRVTEFSQCIQMLETKQIDAILMPEVVARHLLFEQPLQHQIIAVGEPIGTVQRAFGVSRTRPELFKLIDTVTADYLQSEEFKDTRNAWNRAATPSISVDHLVNIDLLLIGLLVILIGTILRHKFRRISESGYTYESNIEIRIISLAGVLFLATLMVSSASIWFLYDTAFQGQKQRLMNIAQSRARLIESIIRYNLANRELLGLSREQSFESSVNQVRNADEALSGFGNSGEFTFAKRAGDYIEFIFVQRHALTSKPTNVPWYSENAEPMRRALSDRTGTLVGLDYRGERVLAAYEPVRVLDAGIVAKIDLAEIRQPYIRAALIILAITLLILTVGILVFFSLTAPIITKLTHSYARLKAIVDHSPAVIVITNKQGETLYASPSAHNIYGELPDEGEQTVLHKDQSVHTYLTTRFPLHSNNLYFGHCQISTDISERVAAEAEIKQLARAFQSTTEAIMITDSENRIITVNKAFEAITGYKLNEVKGQNPRILQSARQSRRFYQKLWHTLKNTGQWRGEIWNRRKNGEIYPEWLNISTIHNNDNQPTHYVAVFSDITAQKESQNQLYNLAYHDPLTQLPNRLLFQDRLDHALKQAHREQNLMALFTIDLDRFKYINDSLGHPVGDFVLKQAAEHLLSLVRETDTVARMGGDEFTVIADGFSDVQSINNLAGKITHGMANNLSIDDQNIISTVSMGIAIYPQDGTTSQELLKNADAALYKAKEHGRNNFQYYTEDLSKSAFECLLLENQIMQGIEREEFILYYQPQYEVATGKLVSAEALVRWNHPDLGMVSPDHFISVAEDTGLIIPLGEWILNQACKQMKSWLEKGYNMDLVAVNLSGAQVERAGLFETVKSALESSGLSAEKLELEVTESFVMRKINDSISLLESFNRLGIRIAIDDFGTGYSSLSYLKRLPVSTLKIDRSFIKDIPDDSEDSAIARAIIALGHSLGLSIVAEGVENKAQLNFIYQENCDLVQGFLKGKPVSPDQFEQLFLIPEFKQCL